MVTAPAACFPRRACFMASWLLIGLAAPAVANPAVPDPVPAALRAGSFPWYDPAKDEIRALKVPAQAQDLLDKVPATNWRWAWGDYLVFGGFVAALVTLVVLVARSWKRFEPIPEPAARADRPSPVATAGMALPAGLQNTGATDDPWAEANRRRQAGDWAGAVVCLFVHQLLAVARLDLVRLAPGRTARQLHRAVADPEFQTLMMPTLRQFEAVYYGHRCPTEREFAVAWEAAEAFERHRRARGAG